MSSKQTSAYGDAATRRTILEATRELLLERGSAIRLNEVAVRAGTSRQAIYLHFGNRQGLVLALVRHMDETLDLPDQLSRVYEADEGHELLARTMRLNTEFWGKVAPVASILVANQEDDVLRSAWRDRMAFRRGTFRRVAERLEEIGDLATYWKVSDAGDLLYATTHFDSWRELTEGLGWSDDRYVEAMTKLLARALLGK